MSSLRRLENVIDLAIRVKRSMSPAEARRELCRALSARPEEYLTVARTWIADVEREGDAYAATRSAALLAQGTVALAPNKWAQDIEQAMLDRRMILPVVKELLAIAAQVGDE